SGAATDAGSAASASATARATQARPPSAEDGTPEREDGARLRGERPGVDLRRLLVEARAVLGAAEIAVRIGGVAADAVRQQRCGLGALQQRDVADVVEQLGTRCAVAEDE